MVAAPACVVQHVEQFGKINCRQTADWPIHYQFTCSQFQTRINKGMKDGCFSSEAASSCQNASRENETDIELQCFRRTLTERKKRENTPRG